MIAYQRNLPVVDSKPYGALMKNHAIHVIVCTSFEGVQNLKKLLLESWFYLKDIPLIVVSQRMKILAHHLGFQTIWVAESASHAAIIKNLAQLRNL